ncbi:MAG TPA: trypsin-like peptidase domain-containing protein [Patescibacteria group bacterium]|nr:trypsin-like peptidase domain-containing protein [Patescibacteria group bacterium]
MSSAGISLHPYPSPSINIDRRIIAFFLALLLILGLYTLSERYTLQFNLPQAPQIQTKGPVRVVTEESATIDAVKQIGQSVVTVVGTGGQSQSPFDLGPFFFGNPNNNDNGSQSQQDQQNIGSGFIVSSGGLIATNKHVVSDDTMTYQVITANNKTYKVNRIFRDPNNDVAILQIDTSQNKGNQLQPAPLGDSSNLQVGQFVVAIGTALGEFRNTVTTGVVSGTDRQITAGDISQGDTENLNNLIQTSAAVNPGNSGGPLVDANEQVIAMNTAIAINGENIGFALPINVVKDFIISL